MTDEQRAMISNALDGIQTGLRQSKRALKDGHFTDLHLNLKAVHTATSKAKNIVVDVALAAADPTNGDDDGDTDETASA